MLRAITLALTSVVLLISVTGCASPSLSSATSIEDYCDGAGKFARAVAAEYRDTGNDLLYTRGAVLLEVGRLSPKPPKREVVKMVWTVKYVFIHLQRKPEELSEEVYRQCVAERTAGTWFSGEDVDFTI